ncbi:hypothetical protein SAMN05421810_103111 [Amycolatopsis arida]|uniref:DUF4386 family protein n=1 Tax=Amycolatopsis arida TaxID=587909 RepID=A0A1I5SFB8_9PSEU|nr:hypothetical protein [Amycolatopsis arida]TDX96504.1 hypothetical protein CLV69_103647 [Amycolatopsis arida]SFP69036.1 hypothetical protein SAMN05421810_103111 [Amycolatopsis arida]
MTSTATRTTTAAPTTRPKLLWGAVALVAGTVLYAAMSFLHGDPPITEPDEILDYVADRPLWRAEHMVNILAVFLWLGAFTALTGATAGTAAHRVARYAQATLTATAGVYTVYFGIHAFGTTAMADRWVEASGAAREAMLTETQAVLDVLASVAFPAQGLLGLSILLYGVSIALSTDLPRWLGWIGAVAGAGWLAGAVLMTFSVIVPFTTVAWVWMIALAVVMVKGKRE